MNEVFPNQVSPPDLQEEDAMVKVREWWDKKDYLWLQRRLDHGTTKGPAEDVLRRVAGRLGLLMST